MKEARRNLGERTCESILEADLAVAECVIDHRCQTFVEIHGAGKEALVVLGIEVLIRACGGSGAIGSTL